MSRSTWQTTPFVVGMRLDVNRYEQIREVEDLGLAYPPADCTDDLVGVQKDDLAPAATGDEVDVQLKSHEEN